MTKRIEVRGYCVESQREVVETLELRGTEPVTTAGVYRGAQIVFTPPEQWSARTREYLDDLVEVWGS